MQAPEACVNLRPQLSFVPKARGADALWCAKENPFRRFFDLGLIGMALTSPTKGILEVNDELCRILGYERDELLQKTWAELTHPEDLGPDMVQFNRVLSGEIDGYQLDKRWIRKDGRIIDSIMATKCVRHPAGTVDYFVGLVLDVTERKGAEDSLRASEEKYRTLYDSIDEGFCTIQVLFDKNGKAIDYVFLEVNAFFEKQTGIRNAQGRRIREIAPATEEHWFEIYGKIALTGEPMRFENAVAQLNRWYDVYAFRVGCPQERKVAILLNDITARKRAETELLALEVELATELTAMTRLHEFSTSLLGNAELEPTLQRALDAVISLQGADFGMIQLNNPSTGALEITVQHGFREDFREHFSGAHGVSSACVQALKSKERVIIEDVLNDPDSAPHRGFAASAGFRAVQSTPLLNRDGEVLGILSTQFRQPHRTSDRDLRLTDLYARQLVEILVRKRTEDALRTTQADLAHVARVLSMGELTSSIAHEINQPLTVIVANANACQRLLQADGLNLEEVRAAVTDIVAAGQRAAGVIAQIRNLLKKRTPEKVPLNVNDLIGEAIALIHHVLHKNKVAICTELGRDTPCILGDRIQLEQVILNLIMNGIEAMSSINDRPRVLALRSANDGAGNVHVEVTDSGVGFLTTSVEEIFDTFFTTKPSGMGMGLSISRSIVASHGGRLWATPNVQCPGATFQFTLPGMVDEKR
jgi:PAS domain S-box-containing protein